MVAPTPADLAQTSALPLDHSQAQVVGAHDHRVIPDASRAARRTSFAPADFAVPRGREEDWRFAPVAALQPLLEPTQVSTAGVKVHVQLGGQMLVENLLQTDPRVGLAGQPDDRAAAVAWASCSEVTAITLPAGSRTDTPTRVRIEGISTEPSAQQILVEAQAGAQGLVVLEHVGSAQLTQTVEIVAHDGAQLTVISVQGWGRDSKHLSSQRVLIGRDAKVTHLVVSLGGEIVRVTPQVQFAGPGGDFNGSGLYFADAGQYLEHRLFVDHSAPSCRSLVTYKGALQGEGAHCVWVGDVLIRAAAEGTDTYELNRNLVLGDGTRTDSIPNLEIETGEILGAGHASATGRFDDDQLFYLCSRGITPDEAKRIVVRGFFAEVLEKIADRDLAGELMVQIDAELGNIEGAL